MIKASRDMNREDSPTSDDGYRGGDGIAPDGVNRRDVLRFSAATGAVGMLAGCLGGGDVLPAGGGTPELETPTHHGCPKVSGVENGFVWVTKEAAGPWLGDIRIGGDEHYAHAGDGRSVQGTANIGQGKVEFHEPGEYTFRYKVDSEDLTWVEQPETLMSAVYAEEPYATNGLVTGANVVDYSVYPYSPSEPLSMSFEIDEPGVYRIAYGPAKGAFLFEEWLPALERRHNHLNLGVAIDGAEGSYSWVYPEIPEHVNVWFGDEDMVVSREPHPPDIECELDPGALD